MGRFVRSIEISELRALCVAIEMGSLGKAARLLRVSQPALSKRLRGLELMVGTQLLERSPRGVSATEAGRQIHAKAREILDQVGELEEMLEAVRGEDPPIRLAVSHTIAELVLPVALASYRSAEGGRLSLELTVANSLEVQRLLGEGRADVGIAALAPGERPAAGLEEQPFLDDEVVIGVPSNHRWAQREEIPLSLLTETPMIVRDPQANTRRVVESELASRGLELAEPLLEIGSAPAAREAARTQNAPVLLSALSIRGERGLQLRRAEGLRFRRRFVVLFPAAEGLGAHVKRFITHLEGESERRHEG